MLEYNARYIYIYIFGIEEMFHVVAVVRYDPKITKNIQYFINTKISFHVHVRNSSNFLVNDDVILHF